MTRQNVPSEVEVKLEAASSDALRHVAQLRVLDRFRLRPHGVQHLHTVYFDTRDFALARAGIALRARQNGRAWEATAKWSGRSAGALHERPELTVVLPSEPRTPFAIPDGPLRSHLGPVVLGRRLMPVLVSEVRRQLRDLLPVDGSAGEPLAEVALDSVELCAPNGSAAAAQYYEVEIERRGGKRRDLLTFATSLQQRFGLVPSRASKFVRGLTELYGDHAPPRQPSEIQASDTVASATRTIVAAQLGRLRAADPGTRAGDAEAVHEARVAVRRLRSATRTFEAGFAPRLRKTVIDELKWIGRELGAVRDLDVQLANLAWHRPRLPRSARRHLEAFHTHLESERAVRRATLIAHLDSRRYARLLQMLERFSMLPPRQPPRRDGAKPVAAVGRRAIKRTMRKLTDRGDAIGDVPEADELHALRIRSKRLRYVLEALKPISDSPGKKLTRKLVRLQDVLGRFNDSMVAATFLRAYLDGPGTNADPEERKTLAALADRELRRAGAAQSDFARAWRRFTGRATLRERRALLRKLKTAARSCAARDATGASAAHVPQLAGP